MDAKRNSGFTKDREMSIPRLTVLMPVYNSEKFLREAIDSILSQTFGDFEFIIINDGSYDESDKIIRSYKDVRIRYYQNEKNKGITYTLNSGIDLARSELIARMDADDVCYPDRLQRQMEFIMTHPGGALYSCAVIEVDEQRQFIRKDDFHPDHFYYNLTFANWIYHPSMVYRKACVKAVGKYTLPYAEDWELTWQLSRQYKIYHQPEVLLEYRLSSHSLSRDTKKAENSNAMFKQAQRNIRYYMGEKAQLEPWIVEVITNVEATAKKKHSIFQVLKCLNTLTHITGKILQKNNINRDYSAIQSAARKKKEYLLAVYSSKLGLVRGTFLFLLAGEWRPLYKKLTARISSTIVTIAKFI